MRTTSGTPSRRAPLTSARTGRPAASCHTSRCSTGTASEVVTRTWSRGRGRCAAPSAPLRVAEPAHLVGGRAGRTPAAGPDRLLDLTRPGSDGVEEPGVGLDEQAALGVQAVVLRIAAGGDPVVRGPHRERPRASRGCDVRLGHPVDVRVDLPQSAHQLGLVGVRPLPMQHAVLAPPRHLELRRPFCVQGQPLVARHERVEPAQNGAGGVRVVVRTGRPQLVRPEHIPRPEQRARPPHREALADHDARRPQHQRPVVAVVAHPRVALRPPDRNRVELPHRRPSRHGRPPRVRACRLTCTLDHPAIIGERRIMADCSHSVPALLQGMDALVTELEAECSPGRYFLSTYTRTTRAVGAALEDGRFEDPFWVEDWDIVFADLYLDALRAYRADPASAPRPWRVAFTADPSLPPVAHLLLGMNAHINYDLPQALIAAIPAGDFDDAHVMDRRRRDHVRIDEVLAERVGAEDV